MKRINIVLVAVLLLLSITKGQAQLGLNNIPDQYVIYPATYDDVIVADFITGTACYEVDYQVIPIGGMIGNPLLGDNEYNDYRENMTVTMKLHYAGFQNFMGHTDDRIWMYDDIGRMVETNTIHDNQLVAGEKVFFLLSLIHI